LTRKKPKVIGSAVPYARSRRNDDVSSARNAIRDIVEKMNAESPNPDTTTPVASPRCKTS